MSDIIIGDEHLDKVRKVTYGNADIWNNKPFEITKSIIDFEKPTRIIFLGDIFDKYKPDSLSTVKFISMIKDIDTYIIEGNHDRPKMNQPYCFEELDTLSNITIIKRNTISNFAPKFYGIGWCDTQEIFVSKLELLLDEIEEESILCLHCNHSDWRNEMDNYIPENIINQFSALNVTIFAGHDHSHFAIKNFISLGSVIPNNIGEIGEKKYWSSKTGLVTIDTKVGNSLKDDVILLRKEPFDIDPNKAYYIKTKNAIEQDDLKLEEKNLHIDILEDFTTEAIKAGFDLEYVNKHLGGTDDN